MVPVRLHIEGFKSYREPQTFLFDGAPLWALSGPNGAGKSSAFDAIYFALFGANKPGILVNLGDLAHHGCDGFLVELDFDLGPDQYRVRRARKKSGSTCSVLRLPSETPVEGTDGVRGFDEWVTREIGLTKETFVRSVYLRQNHGVELVEGTPGDRYTVLKEVVNLRRYEDLHERAKEEAARSAAALEQADGATTSLRREIARDLDLEEDAPSVALGPALQTAIESDTAQIDSLTTEVAQLEKRRDEMAGLRPQAEAWDKRRGEIDHLERSRAALAGVLDDAEVIREAAAEASGLGEAHAALSALGTAMETLTHALEAEAEANKTHQAHHDAREAARSDLDAAAPRLSAAHCALDRLTEERERLSQSVERASPATNPLARALDDWDRLATEIERHARAEAEAPPDLDDRLDRARVALAAAERAVQGLPFLRQVREHRSALLTARAACGDAERDQAASEAEGHRLAAARTENEQLSQAAAEEVTQSTRDEATAAEAQRSAATALADFSEAADGADCRLCGQALTPDHVAEHRDALEGSLADATRRLENARQSAETAQTALDDARERGKTLDRQIADVQRRCADAARVLSSGQASQDAALAGLRAAYDGLQPEIAERVAHVRLDTPDGWVTPRTLQMRISTTTRPRPPAPERAGPDTKRPSLRPPTATTTVVGSRRRRLSPPTSPVSTTSTPPVPCARPPTTPAVNVTPSTGPSPRQRPNAMPRRRRGTWPTRGSGQPRANGPRPSSPSRQPVPLWGLRIGPLERLATDSLTSLFNTQRIPPPDFASSNAGSENLPL